MVQIVDRRQNGRHKSAVNRQRFIKRFKQQIRQSIEEKIESRSIKDVESGEKITISKRDTQEPTFHHQKSGHREIILPGNKEFQTGDKLPRPTQSEGQGSQSSNSDQIGMDDFIFEINKDELLDIFFEDLALPDMVKKQFAEMSKYQHVRAGFTTTGTPNNLNIIRTFKRSIGRRHALRSIINKKITELEQEIKKQEKQSNADNVNFLKNKIELLKVRKSKIPFLEKIDLRFTNKIQQYLPSTQAVMLCIMDVSGSMDKTKKYLAKRFFILLYLFLKRNYEKIDIVFIRHHTSAKEVEEEEFFYSRETGGTVVSSALQLASKIIEERYDPSIWNIYAAQASDGDNWNADSPLCSEILIDKIMPKTQYYAYVEIMPRMHQSLWESYLLVKERYTNFAMQTINQVADIYPVFRELFKKVKYEK